MTKYEELIEKLKVLFELDKADLVFGIHRIIKSRHREILRYLQGAPGYDGPMLKRKVIQVLGDLQAAGQEDESERLRTEIIEEFGRRAFNDAAELVNEDAKAHDLGRRWMVLQDGQGHYGRRSMEQLETEVYSHLLEFFGRYYEEGDFISLRRTRAGAKPYAIPYSGEEVVLHWANKDQYYIKSSEDLKDYTFTVEEMGSRFRVHFKCARMDPVANNNKAHRAFVLDDEGEIEATDDSLVIPFYFKIFERKPTEKQQVEALEESLMAALGNEWKTRLNQQDTSYTGSGERTLLQKHLQNYTRKSTTDYFIHKDLGGFLKQELDFYIKNEVMYLDDVDNRPADYLTAEVRKIKAIRSVAKDLIDFLAQFENFQKRLWLKKKFVTECHYCITLDRIIENAPELLPEIAANEAQRKEGVKLYAIDEIR
ncbi:MAG: site-specific DNA-methyltransferase, partial [Puniceicoccaceae bacterium]